MVRQRKMEIEQKLIDHEVRLSRAREAGERYVARREALNETQTGEADLRWYRDQLISMLMDAHTEADLEGLGLSDAVVREARLGDSLRDAWTRFHTPIGLTRPAERADRIAPRRP